MADGLLIRLVLGEFGSPYSMFMNLINQAVKKTIIDTVFIFLLTKENCNTGALASVIIKTWI